MSADGITVVMKYLESDLTAAGVTDEDKLGIYWIKPDDPAFYFVSSVLDTVANSLVFTVPELGMAGLYEIESIGVDEPARETPRTGHLKPSFPNPFSQHTRIPFDLGYTQPVRVAIYSITGQLIASLAHREMSAGSQEITWDGRDDSGRVVPPGVYFCRIETGVRTETSRAVIVR